MGTAAHRGRRSIQAAHRQEQARFKNGLLGLGLAVAVGAAIVGGVNIYSNRPRLGALPFQTKQTIPLPAPYSSVKVEIGTKIGNSSVKNPLPIYIFDPATGEVSDPNGESYFDSEFTYTGGGAEVMATDADGDDKPDGCEVTKVFLSRDIDPAQVDLVFRKETEYTEYACDHTFTTLPTLLDQAELSLALPRQTQGYNGFGDHNNALFDGIAAIVSIQENPQSGRNIGIPDSIINQALKANLNNPCSTLTATAALSGATLQDTGLYSDISKSAGC